MKESVTQLEPYHVDLHHKNGGASIHFRSPASSTGNVFQFPIPKDKLSEAISTLQVNGDRHPVFPAPPTTHDPGNTQRPWHALLQQHVNKHIILLNNSLSASIQQGKLLGLSPPTDNTELTTLVIEKFNSVTVCPIDASFPPPFLLLDEEIDADETVKVRLYLNNNGQLGKYINVMYTFHTGIEPGFDFVYHVLCSSPHTDDIVDHVLEEDGGEGGSRKHNSVLNCYAVLMCPTPFALHNVSLTLHADGHRETNYKSAHIHTKHDEEDYGYSNDEKTTKLCWYDDHEYNDEWSNPNSKTKNKSKINGQGDNEIENWFYESTLEYQRNYKVYLPDHVRHYSKFQPSSPLPLTFLPGQCMKMHLFQSDAEVATQYDHFVDQNSNNQIRHNHDESQILFDNEIVGSISVRNMGSVHDWEHGKMTISWVSLGGRFVNLWMYNCVRGEYSDTLLDDSEAVKVLDTFEELHVKAKNVSVNLELGMLNLGFACKRWLVSQVWNREVANIMMDFRFYSDVSTQQQKNKHQWRSSVMKFKRIDDANDETGGENLVSDIPDGRCLRYGSFQMKPKERCILLVREEFEKEKTCNLYSSLSIARIMKLRQDNAIDGEAESMLYQVLRMNREKHNVDVLRGNVRAKKRMVGKQLRSVVRKYKRNANGVVLVMDGMERIFEKLDERAGQLNERIAELKEDMRRLMRALERKLNNDCDT